METKDLHIDKSNDLHIIAVTGPDINNGPGFRVTIWVSGCTHACPGCQNKHTWKYGQGHKLDDMVPYHPTYDLDHISRYAYSDNQDMHVYIQIPI